MNPPEPFNENKVKSAVFVPIEMQSSRYALCHLLRRILDKKLSENMSHNKTISDDTINTSTDCYGIGELQKSRQELTRILREILKSKQKRGKQMGNVCYIGIDLGDKTLSINEVKSGIYNAPAEVSLPGQNGNQPIQSAVGYLKSGEMILADRFDNIPVEQFTKILANFKRRPSSLASSDEAQTFSDGVKSLLDIVLESDVTRQAVRGLSQNSDEIVFCIGYPTNWDEQDRTIYERIVHLSVLGKYARDGKFLNKSMRLIFERESTAAFVYIKLFSNNLLKIAKNDKVLLLDFGSSTLNVTALTTDSRTTMYNSGHNFFGGRFIDCLIADYYLEMITGEERDFFNKFDRDSNGIGSMLLLLAASEAKERLSDAELTRINLLDIKSSVKLTREMLDMLLKRPMAPVIRKYGFIPDNECDKFGNMGWINVLHSYLKQEKVVLTQKRIEPNIVILTGGGAILYTVQEACRDIFGEIQMLDARESTKTISKGLALAAKRADQSAQFDHDVQEFINKRLIKIIERELPSLTKSLSVDITEYICNTAIAETIRWRDGNVKTLDNVTTNIKSKCSSENIKNQWKIKESLKIWSIKTLGATITQELEILCRKYNSENFRFGRLINIEIPEIEFKALSTQVDDISAIISYIVLVIVGVVVVVITGIATGPLAVLLVPLLSGAKDVVAKNIAGANLPKFARKVVGESKIKKSVNESKADIESKIHASLASESSKQSMSQQISKSIAEQVRTKMYEIRYLMETD